MTFMMSYCRAVKFRPSRYDTNKKIYSSIVEVTSIIHGPTKDPFDFSKSLLARVSKLGRTYLTSKTKDLYLDSLIMSIKPNVRRYWEDHFSDDIDSLLNYTPSRMRIPLVEEIVIPRPTPDKRLCKTKGTMLSQILDIEEEVI